MRSIRVAKDISVSPRANIISPVLAKAGKTIKTGSVRLGCRSYAAGVYTHMSLATGSFHGLPTKALE